MELILICKECGHEEIGETERVLMAKVRMWNHLNRVHPEMTEAFKAAVREESAAEAQKTA